MKTPETEATKDGRPSGLAVAPCSAIDEFHCPRCGKLKLTLSGQPHKCGPTDKQIIERLEREKAEQYLLFRRDRDELAEKLSVARGALKVIYTWATFERGQELVPRHTAELVDKALVRSVPNNALDRSADDKKCE